MSKAAKSRTVRRRYRFLQLSFSWCKDNTFLWSVLLTLYTGGNCL